ncbi:hypothetical protein [Ekhidna sp.]|uniref:hypothetical protein n=1 Tax=Ekhidna sp. TaxID=2608089 RepID=UPI003B503071
MKRLIFVLFCGFTLTAFSQRPIYDFVSFEKTTIVPEGINNSRSAVIFSFPVKTNGEFEEVESYEKVISQVHKGLRTMGIDAILYLNDINLLASQSARKSYVDIFNKRKINNIIFLTKTKNGFELIIARYNESPEMIAGGSKVFYMASKDLYSLLLNVGKEVRRADNQITNFLIPERPNYIQGMSIVEKTLLKNYPGILRRSELAVERFTPLDTTNISEDGIRKKVLSYNSDIAKKNQELEEIMKSYPYKYLMIDPMSDDELKRNRYQFLLRSACAPAQVVKQMLDYEVLPSETGFVSIIPIMPDQTKVKTIPREALVCKFYIRQNISKNVHVGEWDADVSWQDALRNMIGNLIQEHNVGN